MRSRQPPMDAPGYVTDACGPWYLGTCSNSLREWLDLIGSGLRLVALPRVGILTYKLPSKGGNACPKPVEGTSPTREPSTAEGHPTAKKSKYVHTRLISKVVRHRRLAHPASGELAQRFERTPRPASGFVRRVNDNCCVGRRQSGIDAKASSQCARIPPKIQATLNSLRAS
jgi:hypothetical protein